MNMALAFFLARMKEPSTWATAVGTLGYFGVHPSDEAWQAITKIVIGAATLLGLFLSERGRHDGTPPSAPCRRG